MSDTFETQVAQYIRDFPYQETYRYAMVYTGGDPSLLNVWTHATPELIKAGKDEVIVRTNNDTFYKSGFISLAAGPVVLSTTATGDSRFVSLQLMDDRNVNYHNIINPHGTYTLYHGDRPDAVQGEAIPAPSEFGFVLARVEVRDGSDPADVQSAKVVYEGLTIDGPLVGDFPHVDRLSEYPSEVAAEAHRRLDQTFADEPFTVVGPGEEPGVDVPVLSHSASTKGGWGGPARDHSDYETIQTDEHGELMFGRDGPYVLTTQEPPVDGFWSITAYDTERGGFFHPNVHDRYHINNTTAERNKDATVTITFRTSCGPDDGNCLEVPEGQFDVVARYYAPKRPILDSSWRIRRPVRQQQYHEEQPIAAEERQERTTMDQLPLYAEVMLLALHDEKGTVNAERANIAAAGGGVLELLLQNRITVDDNGVVEVIDETPTDDTTLDMILVEMASSTKPRKLKSWMKRLSKKTTRVVAIHRLMDDGIVVDKSTTVLGVFDRSAFPEIDPQPEAEIVARLRIAVIDGHDPSERTAALLGLGRSTKLLGAAFNRQELRSYKGRIDEIVDEYMLVNKAAAATLAGVEAIPGALVGAGVI